MCFIGLNPSGPEWSFDDRGFENFKLPRAFGAQTSANAQGKGKHGPRGMAYRGAINDGHTEGRKISLADLADGWVSGDCRLAFREIAKDDSMHVIQFARLF